MAYSRQHQTAWNPRDYVRRSLKDLCIDSVTVTSHELGKGAYGVIHAVEFNGASCAGKQLHPVFFHGTKTEHRQLLLERFVTECRFHSLQRHPNIVQLLGVHFEADSVLPMLVMELMDTSLHHFLDEHSNIPVAVKNSILLDISLGLLHLHTQMVVHRDLTATNVLLTNSLTAKITDLGMARIIDPRVAQAQHLTIVPGAQAAMAPEACMINSVYNYKLDVFSFGVVALQVHTQVFPAPDEALYRMDTSQPTGRVTLTAIERRRSYIDLLEDSVPIRSLVLRCLSDDPEMRPTTSSIVLDMKITCSQAPPPTKSTLLLVKKVTLLEEEITQLKTSMMEEQEKLSHCKEKLKEKEEELKKQCGTVDSLSKANSTLYRMLSAKIQLRDKPRKRQGSDAMGVVNSRSLSSSAPSSQARKHFTTFESGEASVAPYERTRMSTVVQRNRQWTVCDVNGESLMATKPTKEESKENLLEISVETCSDLPIPLYNGQTVLLMGKVYIGGYQQAGNEYPNAIYQYDPVTDNWECYAHAPTGCFALAVFRNQLTVVGGVVPITNRCSSAIYTFDNSLTTEKWTALKETMSCGKKGAVAVGFAAYLLVAGGIDEEKVIDILEIYHDETSQWHSILPSVPWRGTAHIKTTFVQASWYLLTGETDGKEILHRFPVTFLLENLASSNIRSSPWKILPSTVSTKSTIGVLCQHLLTVGGRTHPESPPSPLIHCLTETEDNWVEVSRLPEGVEHAASIALSKNCLLVIGGLTSSNNSDEPVVPKASVYKLIV